MTVSGSFMANFPEIESIFGNIPSPYDDLEAEEAPDDPEEELPIVKSFFSADMDNAPYEFWTMDTVYAWEDNVVAMPVAAPSSGTGGQNGIGVLPTPGDTNRQESYLVRLTAPYGSIAVYWMARRIGVPPIVPKPIVNDNAVLIRYRLRIRPPAVLLDNTKRWQWSGQYIFALKKPIWLLDGLNPGKTPVHTLKATDNIIAATQFQEMFKEEGGTKLFGKLEGVVGP